MVAEIVEQRDANASPCIAVPDVAKGFVILIRQGMVLVTVSMITSQRSSSSRNGRALSGKSPTSDGVKSKIISDNFPKATCQYFNGSYFCKNRLAT